MWTSYPTRPRSWWTPLVELLYPPSCVGCDTPAGGDDPFFCVRCSIMVAWRDPVRCPLCEQPVAVPRQWCAGCLEIWPRVERVIALGYYAGALRRAVRVFKYGGYRALGHWLGEMLARRVVREVGGIDAVVPVPGGRWRKKRRGFDPPAVVAGPVARWLAAPVEAGVVYRARDGDSSRTHQRVDREVEVRERFRCGAPGALAGARVLLVDDVYTTGASIEEVVRLLREEAGARSVVAAVLARTVLV